MLEFEVQLNRYINQIEQFLSTHLKPRECKYRSVLEAMAYSVAAGGKRIRPVLTLEFCRLCGGEVEKALPFAAAVELVHSYSLIHDDLPCMDDDDFRRGKPSCHKAFGEATALLAGDGLLTEAFRLLSLAELPADRIVKAVSLLAEYAGVAGMIGGQVVDLESEGKEIDTDTLLLTYELKTARLLQVACELGCIAAGAQQIQREAAHQYGYGLGVAFQIVDDILDIEGDSQTLGKPVGSDLENDKKTYVALFGLERAKADAASYAVQAEQGLDTFVNHTFLSALTKMLLKRQK